MLTLDKIYHAAFVLKKVARKTDLIKATKLSDHCELYLKPRTCRKPAASNSEAPTIRSASSPTRRSSTASWPAAPATTPRRGHGRHPERDQIPDLHARRGPHQQGGGHQTVGGRGLPGERGPTTTPTPPPSSSKRRLGPPSSTPLMTMRSSPAKGPSAWKFWTSWKAPMPWWSPLAAAG